MKQGQQRKKIAIIGTGISGLAAACALAPGYDITVYEKNDYIGGHSRTIDVKTPSGWIPVDTGFIVFNHKNYPLLTSLFTHLGVECAKSDMSFGVSIDGGYLEYSTQNLGSIFTQKANILRPSFWRMLIDIFRFNKNAHRYLDADSSLTLGQCLDEMQMGSWFRRYFLLAIGAAIWSTPLKQMLQFPASTFIRFFDNHGLLTVSDQPQWYTVKGGSREYIKKLTSSFKGNIRTSCAIVKAHRGKNGITLHSDQGQEGQFDEVIFACHSDQALSIIASPTKQEQDILGNLRYRNNRIIVHSDTGFMPRRKNAWASWSYIASSQHSGEISLSYWMNNLQPLGTDYPVIVTLNPSTSPDKNLIHDEYEFEHPVFDAQAVQAQKRIDDIQGHDQFWFCGAYQRYGFHEDGLLSAVNMLRQMGIKPQWI